jgi:hypothetical protein
MAGVPMSRYQPARYYLWFGIHAVVLAAAAAWYAWYRAPESVPGMVLALLPCVLFVVTAGSLFFMALRPVIEIREGHVNVGQRVIPWMDIRRVDRTGWLSPLILRITLFDDSRLLVIFPGDLDSCNSLLRQFRRMSRDALIDGIPYRQYWGEVLAESAEKPSTMSPRYRILLPEDEAEVERLYQRLKTVGNLDQKNSTDEK